MRIWQSIYPDLPANTGTVENVFGWFSPYIEGKQSTDAEIADALIDIYNRTGRIVVDAPSPRNFITTADGQVICVDIALSLAFGMKNEVQLGLGDLKRSPSSVSINFWREMTEECNTFFTENLGIYPQTIITIKALLFLRLNNLDIFEANFLKKNFELMQRLAQVYNKPNEVSLCAEVLCAYQDMPLNHAKRACVKALLAYIHSRGTYDGKEFHPSLVTKWCRDLKTTQQKVCSAWCLINNFLAAGDFENLKELLTDELSTYPISSSGKGLMHSHYNDVLKAMTQIISHHASDHSAVVMYRN